MLQQFRHLFDHIVYGETTGLAYETTEQSAAAASRVAPGKADHCRAAAGAIAGACQVGDCRRNAALAAPAQPLNQAELAGNLGPGTSLRPAQAGAGRGR